MEDKQRQNLISFFTGFKVLAVMWLIFNAQMHAGKRFSVIKKSVCAFVFSYFREWERQFSATLCQKQLTSFFSVSLLSPFAPLLSLISTLSSTLPPITSRRRALWGWGSVMVTMVPGGRYVCSAHAREDDSGNDREERILAVLGIIGTILNLLVVIFVYIYTSVT